MPETEHEHEPPLAVGFPAKLRRRWVEGSTERLVIDHGGGDVRRYRRLDIDSGDSNVWVTTREKR